MDTIVQNDNSLNASCEKATDETNADNTSVPSAIFDSTAANTRGVREAPQILKVNRAE